MSKLVGTSNNKLNKNTECGNISAIGKPWIIKLLRRIIALAPGRYQIILSVEDQQQDWTVIELGKIEKSK